jgi:hypothetical protein
MIEQIVENIGDRGIDCFDRTGGEFPENKANVPARIGAIGRIERRPDQGLMGLMTFGLGLLNVPSPIMSIIIGAMLIVVIAVPLVWRRLLLKRLG